MTKITLDNLCSLSICDAVVEKIEITDDITIAFSDSPVKAIVFHSAMPIELRIKGYEVLDENEEVVFDMPDVEILGEKIPDALATLLSCAPHAVGFHKLSDFSAVFTATDATDTYELELTFKELRIEN